MELVHDIFVRRNANVLLSEFKVFEFLILQVHKHFHYVPNSHITSRSGLQVDSFFPEKGWGFPKKGVDICKTFMKTDFFLIR